mgnify:CR=1 FL=1
MDREIMTVKGSELLREELKKLKSVDRPEIITAIATAREFGDLKENAEYHAAKEEQAKLEGRIIEINDLIARSYLFLLLLALTQPIIYLSECIP